MMMKAILKRYHSARIGLLLNLSIGLVFVVAAAVTIVFVRENMHQQALAEAETKMTMLLDHNLAVHSYFSQTLKPNLFEWTEPLRSPDYFDPIWMSSSYAVREMNKLFNAYSISEYYYKDAAINARNPENEADADERAFLEELKINPSLSERSSISTIDGKPYLVVLRPGEMLEESCLRCHGDPQNAPGGLVRQYGSELSFHREAELGTIISAVSVRVPLAAAYAEADRLTLRLSASALALLGLLFVVQFWLQRHLIFAPLAMLRDKALQISTTNVQLGEQIAEPFGEELGALTRAFNKMSVNLRENWDQLEERVQERTMGLNKSEELLRAFSARQEAILSAVPDIIAEVDKDKVLTWTNPAGFAFYGEDVIGKEAVFYFDGEQDTYDQVGPLFGGSENVIYVESWQRRKDGEKRLLAWHCRVLKDTHGNVTGALSSAHDITERKRAEEDLRESEARTQAMLRAIPDMIFRTDRQGVFLYYKADIADLYAQSESSIIGKRNRDITPPEFADLMDQQICATLETGTLQTFEYQLPVPGQGLRYYEARMTASGADEVLAFVRDITDRKWAEQQLAEYAEHLEERVQARTRELRESQEKLVRQERLAVLGQVAGSIGHELRNPLSVISNASYYLKLFQPDADEKVKEYLGLIEKATRSAERIITDLLDFSRIKASDRQAVNVAELVQQTLERFPVPASIAVNVDIPPDLQPVYANPPQMTQVLGNLIINACQAMPDGGKLSLSAAAQSQMIMIAVQDTGAGITPENMNKLFEPLFTTKTKGVGLGLAVSKKLVEANNGRIEAQSEIGKGSTFTVYLPVDKGPK